MNWTKAKLGEIGKFYSGLSGKTAADFGSGRPFISYNSVFGSSRCFIAGQPLVRLEQGERQNTVSNGDIILTGSSETAEEVAMSSLYCDQAQAYLNSFCIGFSYDHQRLMPCYAEYFFRGQEFRRSVFPLAQGSTRFNISREELTKVVITLPSLAEQRKIAEILRTWDDAIETAQAELKVKQERKRWLMHKLLTCPSKHNSALHQNTWTTVGLGEVASFQNGEAFSSRYFNSEKRGLRLIRNRDLKNDDQIIFYDGEYSAKDVVNDGDLLVGMDGDFTPVIWSKGKALLNQRVGRITVKPEISQTYIYYTLYSVLTELEHVTSATTVKHLSSKGCLLLKISMPPFTSQCLISGILQSADADIESINQRIDSLRTQKRGLMQKLLTGEVRVAV